MDCVVELSPKKALFVLRRRKSKREKMGDSFEKRREEGSAVTA